ncbi:hypothetical protein B0H14DRAFT_3455732 [Mycena olivaceomarginata]|nr:hypothetical protein B0H14DRAFT_3455732 [Mycena olivaceomarginata]
MSYTTPVKSRRAHAVCDVPIHYDPGWNLAAPVKKFWLVTGFVKQPGAYVSWPSCEAQVKRVPAATYKGYEASEWDALVSAWHASCLRGEHAHENDELQQPPHSTPIHAARIIPTTPVSSRKPSHSQVVLAPRTVATESPSPLVSEFALHVLTFPFAAACQPHGRCSAGGKSAYAIKCGCEGRHRGKHPVFAIFQSFTAAVAFIEGEEDEHSPSDNSERGQWIDEELEVFEACARLRTAALA